MARYIGEKCPVCEEVFTDNDDIVVCPKCGAPHHRECWFKDGRCAFENHHDVFEWEPENSETSASGFNANKTLGEVCANCGANNPPGTLFCPTCGMPRNVSSSEAENSNPYVRFERPFKGKKVDGVSSEDLAEFIGGNSYKYLEKFITKKHNGFNWGAFLFGPWWFMFRKMYKYGAVFACILAIISVSFMGPVNRSYEKTYEAQEAFAAAETEEQQNEAAEKILEVYASRDFALTCIAGGFFLAVSVICGCIGNTAYRKYCVKTIKNTDYSQLEKQGYFSKTIFIRRKGGANPFAAAGAFLVYRMFLYIIALLVLL